MMADSPTYEELLFTFVPRPITAEAQYNRTVAKMNALIDKGDLTPDEQDFLTLLGTLVRVNEDVHFPDEAFELPERRIGHAKNVILSMADDFNAPLDDFQEYMV